MLVDSQEFPKPIEVNFHITSVGNLPYCVIVGAEVIASHHLVVSAQTPKPDVCGVLTNLSMVACFSSSGESDESPDVANTPEWVTLDRNFIKVTQGKNGVIQQLFALLKSKVPRKSWDHKRVKPYVQAYNSLGLKDRVVCYKNTSGAWVPVVTHNLMVDVVTTYHVRTGHVGRDKTFLGVFDLLWHPALRQVVQEVCSSCAQCQLSKVGHQTVGPPYLKIQTTQPFDLLVVDLMAMPQSSRGFEALLAAVDHYSKWISLVPLKNKRSETVCRAMREQVLPSLLRTPVRILSDNGPEWISGNFRDLCESLNIKHVFTTPRTPSSAGLVERVNRTVQELLRGFKAENRYWDQKLPDVLMSYHSTVHSSLGKSPSQKLLGEAHIVQAKPPIRAQDQEKWTTGHPKYVPYRRGQLVVKKVHFEGRLNVNKLKNRYYGPFRISRVNTNGVSYVLATLEGPDKTIRAHHRTLKKWVRPPQYLVKCPLFKQECMSDQIVLPDGWDMEDHLMDLDQSVQDQGALQGEETSDHTSATENAPACIGHWVPSAQVIPVKPKKRVIFNEQVAVQDYDPTDTVISLNSSVGPIDLANLSCSEPGDLDHIGLVTPILGILQTSESLEDLPTRLTSTPVRAERDPATIVDPMCSPVGVLEPSLSLHWDNYDFLCKTDQIRPTRQSAYDGIQAGLAALRDRIDGMGLSTMGSQEAMDSQGTDSEIQPETSSSSEQKDEANWMSALLLEVERSMEQVVWDLRSKSSSDSTLASTQVQDRTSFGNIPSGLEDMFNEGHESEDQGSWTEPLTLRRSKRIRRAPIKFGDYIRY
jgi:transposase InsO family protein